MNGNLFAGIGKGKREEELLTLLAERPGEYQGAAHIAEAVQYRRFAKD